MVREDKETFSNRSEETEFKKFGIIQPSENFNASMLGQEFES